MCCKNLLLKFSVFAIAFGLGLLVSGLLITKPISKIGVIPNGPVGSGLSGTGGHGANFVEEVPVPAKDSKALFLYSKPSPIYTDAARNNSVQGVVRLKVTFLATGEIGVISVVSGLPDGLTEQAIAAAKQIKFEPKKVNSVPVSVARIVEFSFTIY